MYDKDLPDYGDLMTREEYLKNVESGLLIDYDGVGHPVLANKMDRSIWLSPLQVEDLPETCTHVMWFNR